MLSSEELISAKTCAKTTPYVNGNSISITPHDNRLEFKQAEDVTRNCKSLGQRKKVFIYYISMANSFNERYNEMLKIRVRNFAHHLITYGFDVKVDLFADISPGFDLIHWTEYELSQADWIIYVCSRSSYDMFSLLNGTNGMHFDEDIQRKMVLSQKILYNCLSNNNSMNVAPVILLVEDNNIDYVPPSLQDKNNILHIYEDAPFDYTNLSGHFERLVCRMAGINRQTINMSRQIRGFVELPSIMHQNNSVNGSQRNVAVNLSYESQHTEGFRTQFSPQHHYHNGSHEPRSIVPSVNAPVQHQEKAVVHQGYLSTTQLTQGLSEVQPQLGTYQNCSSGYMSNGQLGVSQSLQYHNSQHVPSLGPFTMNYSTSSSVRNGLESKQTKIDSLLDYKIPPNSPILWELSLEVREWKFLARYLDLEENIIEEIDQYTVPNKMRDKALRVFKEWINSAPYPTWRALGDALFEAEYALLYEKLLELVRAHAI
ncbi:uncharacterized protein [Dysidea avara]|uniref:uncharacterized protein isoform X2 n=1 Tax=Dysidea avara TaxID=196820 RepID=UPI003319C749